MQEQRLRGDGPTAAAARLEGDGCTGSDATGRRILWLAHERNLF
jgi:hypothetical protein